MLRSVFFCPWSTPDRVAVNGKGATLVDSRGASPPPSRRVVFRAHIAAPQSGRGGALVPTRQTRWRHHAVTDAAPPALPPPRPTSAAAARLLITGAPPPSSPARARGRRGAARRAPTAPVRFPLEHTHGVSWRGAPRHATVASQAPAPCVGRDARACGHALPPAPAVHRSHPAGVGGAHMGSAPFCSCAGEGASWAATHVSMRRAGPCVRVFLFSCWTRKNTSGGGSNEQAGSPTMIWAHICLAGARPDPIGRIVLVLPPACLLSAPVRDWRWQHPRRRLRRRRSLLPPSLWTASLSGLMGGP